MPLAAGTRFGPYEILAPIGAGGMGEVYRARDNKLGRDVAIKVLHESFAGDPERMARFEREAQVLASLNHPHIATIHGLEESHGVRALVMELVEGPTLAERIGGRAMPLDEALPIAKQIAEGLEYAHEKGIVHRDLKPANVKLTADGNARILDFGLAKALEAPVASGNPSISPTLALSATQAGVILGTAAYMAPEQARGSAVDRRADIWAFGVVLYEMLTGKQPFAGETVSDTLAGVLKTEPDCGAIPAPLRRLVRRCLDKNPKRRLRDIGEARVVIEDVLAGSAEEQLAGVLRPGAHTWLLRLSPWLAGALLLTTLVISWLYFRQTLPAERVVRATVALPAKAQVDSFVLSPDGRYLVLAARMDGTLRLWLRPLDALDPQPLAGTEEAHYPFWSPDSRYIGFFAQGKLKKIAVTGGPTQNLCDAPEGRGGTWNREGTIVFAPTGGVSRLQRVSAGGGVSSPVTRAASGAQRFPIFLPDGHRVLYLANGSKIPEQNGIFLASLDSMESRQVLPDVSNAFYATPKAGSRPAQILFVRNSVLMAQPVNPETLQLAGEASAVVDGIGMGQNLSFFRFSISGTGSLTFQAAPALPSSQLTWFDRSGAQVGVVGQPGAVASFSISPDGKKIALTRSRTSNYSAGLDIWLHELERGTESRFTLKGLVNLSPVWSPDGSSIVYAASDLGQLELHQKRTDGTGQEELLTKGDHQLIPASWSRDGRFVALISTTANRDLFVLTLERDGKPEPFVAGEFQETQGQFSPDGKWMAYTSNETGRFEVYVEPFPHGSGAVGKRAVSVAGGEDPCWRPDGKELFYIDPGGRLLAVPVLISGPKPGFSMGAATTLFDTRLSREDRWLGSPAPAFRSYDVVPDGKRFLVRVVKEQGVDAPLVLVTNWQAVLSK